MNKQFILISVFSYWTGNLVMAMTHSEYARMNSTERYGYFSSLASKLETKKTLATIDTEAPGFRRKLGQAKQVSKEFWTDSTNYDELAKAQILSSDVLKALGIEEKSDTAQQGNNITHVSAGVMHTYGYLFSQLQTQYGKKGKRWLESRLDERLGLKPNTFSLFTLKGEFLSNVTVALKSMIPEADQSLSKKIKLLKHIESKVLENAQTSGRYLGKVEEQVVLSSEKSPQNEVKMKVLTYFLKLDALPGFETKDVALLVHARKIGDDFRFVTAFPIAEDFLNTFKTTKVSEGTSYKPRFNFYLDPMMKVKKYKNLGFVGPT